MNAECRLQYGYTRRSLWYRTRPASTSTRFARSVQAIVVLSEAKWAELVEAHHMYFVYLIECSDKSFYTGITNNLQRRFNQHKNGKGGHYTSSKKVVKIVYTEQHSDKSSALKREAQIKGWTRQKKLNLIKFGTPKV